MYLSSLIWTFFTSTEVFNGSSLAESGVRRFSAVASLTSSRARLGNLVRFQTWSSQRTLGSWKVFLRAELQFPLSLMLALKELCLLNLYTRAAGVQAKPLAIGGQVVEVNVWQFPKSLLCFCPWFENCNRRVQN